MVLAGKKDDIKHARKKIEEWRHDPVQFVVDCFDFEGLHDYKGEPLTEPTWQQSEILYSIADNQFTHIMSGTTIGKTSVFAWATFWFMTVYYMPMIIVTSVNNVLLNDVYWSELSRWYERCGLKDRYSMTTHDKHLWVKGQRKKSFTVARSSERSGQAKESSMSGLHAENMLVLIDEAPGVPREIWEQLIGSCAGMNNKIACAGNPVKADGYFYEIATKYRDTWNCLKFSSLDSPLYNPKLSEIIKNDYGEDSDMYRVRVLGEFPQGGGDDILIRLDKIHTCIHNVVKESGTAQMGVDVARMGSDLTVITIVEGNVVLTPKYQEKTSDFFPLARTIAEEVKKHNVKMIKIDATGMGEGCYDILRRVLNERRLQCKVIPIKFGARAFNQREYANNIAEMWINTKHMIYNEELVLPDHPRLIRELTGRKYEVDGRGRLKIESKQKYKDRKNPSPDFADSLNLALYTRRKMHDIELSSSGSSMFK